jgi:hypothetical protein
MKIKYCECRSEEENCTERRERKEEKRREK